MNYICRFVCFCLGYSHLKILIFCYLGSYLIYRLIAVWCIDGMGLIDDLTASHSPAINLPDAQRSYMVNIFYQTCYTDSRYGNYNASINLFLDFDHV